VYVPPVLDFFVCASVLEAKFTAGAGLFTTAFHSIAQLYLAKEPTQPPSLLLLQQHSKEQQQVIDRLESQQRGHELRLEHLVDDLRRCSDDLLHYDGHVASESKRDATPPPVTAEIDLDTVCSARFEKLKAEIAAAPGTKYAPNCAAMRPRIKMRIPAVPVRLGRGVAWRGVAWRGVAWRGVAWRGSC
jgi:hypothetical protein